MMLLQSFWHILESTYVILTLLLVSMRPMQSLSLRLFFQIFQKTNFLAKAATLA